MLRQTPPLEAIEAFLIAARAPSFRQAAGALALSPSALSRRIQMLEAFVGAPLFDRSGARPRVSEVGVRYLDEIGPAVETIRRATRDLQGADGRIRLSASHSVSAGWLMPRLNRLREEGIDLDLCIAQGIDALRSGEADLAICGGDGVPAGFTSEILLDVDAFVVGAPNRRETRVSRLEDLADCDLLTTIGSPGLWSRWLELAGAAHVTPSRGRSFPTLHAMYEAAASGMGLALAIPLAAERFLSEGRLTPRLPIRAPLGQQYRLVFAEPRQSGRAPVRQFRSWLKTEIAASTQHFEAVTGAA